MKKFRYLVLAAGGYAVLALILNLADPNPSKTHAANTSVGNVQVVNSTVSPVPTLAQGTTNVAGSVGINNTPNVNVANTPNVMISGTPTVNVGTLPAVSISSLPSVMVSNMPTVELDPSMTVPIPNTSNKALLGRDADNPARQPVNIIPGCNINNGAGGCAGQDYIVPLGKELVIEFASAQIIIPTTQKITSLTLRVENPFAVAVAYLAPNYQADDGTSAYFLASQQMRMYADAGTHIVDTCARNNTVGTGSCQFAFSGYLVDVP